MECLQNLKSLLHMVGQFSNNENQRLWYKLYGIFICASMCLILLPMINLLTTMNTIEQYASFIPVGVGTFNGAFKGCYFLLYNKEVRSLLVNLQRSVNSQLSNGRPEKHYKTANETSDFLVNGFRLVMGICGWAPILGPPAYATFHYFRGTLTDDKIKTPIPALLPYDITKLPAYVATCLAYAVTINYIVFSIAAIDTFFMSLSVSFIGCFKDLINMYDDTEELLQFSGKNRNLSDEQRYNAIKQKFKACAKYQSDIYNLIEQFQNLVGPVVFAQYFFSLFQLGTLVFATIMIPGIQPDVVVFNITLMVACLTELSIYCYFGNELTTATKEVSNGIYRCKWYKYHPRLRKYLLLSMTRAQKVTQIHGFYMVIASMETFSLLINLIASAFTLLKSTVVN